MLNVFCQILKYIVLTLIMKYFLTLSYFLFHSNQALSVSRGGNKLHFSESNKKTNVEFNCCFLKSNIIVKMF